MAKDTVRYPDQVVAVIEELVADGVVESKSEFYRFAAEYTLQRIQPGYEPAMFSFGELRSELGVDADGGGTEPGAFLEAAAAVRRVALRGQYEAAETVIDERYAPTDREALVLEELLAAYRRGAAGPAAADEPEEPEGAAAVEERFGATPDGGESEPPEEVGPAGLEREGETTAPSE